MNDFTPKVLRLEWLYNHSPQNASDNGSGPKLSINCLALSDSAHNKHPNRRGSWYRSCKSPTWIWTWSWVFNGVSELTRRNDPLIPRWDNILALLVSISKYFARRVTEIQISFESRWAKSAGMGHRSDGWFTLTHANLCPMRKGAIPRTVVSTSGSSGMTFYLILASL